MKASGGDMRCGGGHDMSLLTLPSGTSGTPEIKKVNHDLSIPSSNDLSEPEKFDMKFVTNQDRYVGAGKSEHAQDGFSNGFSKDSKRKDGCCVM